MNFLKLAEGVDVSELVEQIDSQPELFDQINYRRIGPDTPHAGMQDIWIHYHDYTRHLPDLKNLNDEQSCVWYPSYYKLPAIKPIIFSLMSAVEGSRLGFVLITKIPPGGEILRHKDHSWHVDYFDKFYVQLKSNPEAGFYCEQDGQTEVIFPNVGDIYRFDNRIEHWVNNEGKTDRMTLIICIRTEMFEAHPQLGGAICQPHG